MQNVISLRPAPLRDQSARLFGQAVRTRAHRYLCRDGERPAFVHLLIEGWACRYKLLSDGRRQITGLYMPGDFCELGWWQRDTSSQSVVALTSLRSARISCRAITEQVSRSPALMAALWAEALVQFDIQAEWMLNLGRKSALERLSHFFCEILFRSQRVGMSNGNCCDMPLTQSDLADITGLTPVHVNRTLQDMRGIGLIELQSKRLRVLDLDKAMHIAMFSSHYLAGNADRKASRLVYMNAHAPASTAM